jgi:hypothetical protein
MTGHGIPAATATGCLGHPAWNLTSPKVSGVPRVRVRVRELELGSGLGLGLGLGLGFGYLQFLHPLQTIKWPAHVMMVVRSVDEVQHPSQLGLGLGNLGLGLGLGLGLFHACPAKCC